MMPRKYLLIFLSGAIATLAMTATMLTGTTMDLSPMPRPVPVAIMGEIFGASAPKPVKIALGFVTHFVYGGIWAIILWYLARPTTILKGITLGIILWVIMQLVVLPFLGWGVFGSALTPRIAVATFVLHIVYGGVLGVLGQSIWEHKLRPTVSS